MRQAYMIGTRSYDASIQSRSQSSLSCLGPILILAFSSLSLCQMQQTYVIVARTIAARTESSGTKSGTAATVYGSRVAAIGLGGNEGLAWPWILPHVRERKGEKERDGGWWWWLEADTVARRWLEGGPGCGNERQCRRWGRNGQGSSRWKRGKGFTQGGGLNVKKKGEWEERKRCS
ncbi:hypothetical protein NL676_003941 [Syzygium grande]|nr:hypothetical protein NL676_003941 [Syzygium grande]